VSYRSERFNRRMMSLEVMVAGFADVSKVKIFSDGGAGARAIREGQEIRSRSTMEDALFSDAARCRVYEETREEKLFEAEMRLADAGKSHLIPVLLLIVENGSNREESLKKVPRRTYFLNRKQLLEFFGCTQVHMEI